jgi:dTDP-4-amino-4,6-dideoxygalactose transaminase
VERVGSKHVYHIYPVRVKERDRLIKTLGDLEIHCAVHYPIPIHLQDAYGSLHLREGSFPVAEVCSRELVSLPMFPELTHGQLEEVAQGIMAFLEP